MLKHLSWYHIKLEAININFNCFSIEEVIGGEEVENWETTRDVPPGWTATESVEAETRCWENGSWKGGWAQETRSYQKTNEIGRS